MPPKRKSDPTALSARKEPRLVEELGTVIEVDTDGDLHLAVKDTNLDEHEVGDFVTARIILPTLPSMS